MTTARMSRRGFTLVEVAVAMAVLAIAGVALQRLMTSSVRTIASDAGRARTLAVARERLAEASLQPPPFGRAEWTDPDGLHTIRVVEPTAHPWLRAIRVRSEDAQGHDPSELVELVYAPVR
jgi:prepilin-type N-terminal cleavage/methylation domain-containing protein